MIYTRRELVDLVRELAPNDAELLIALAWFASSANPNLVSSDRYGLLQVDLNQARQAGFTGDANSLLDPRTNVTVAVQLLTSLGLLQYCGRALACQIPAILKLESFLKKQASISVESTQKLVEVGKGG